MKYRHLDRPRSSRSRNRQAQRSSHDARDGCAIRTAQTLVISRGLAVPTADPRQDPNTRITMRVEE